MASSNLVGVDLNIDHDFLSDVVRQVAIASIAEAMDKENHIVEAIVRQVMRQKVNEEGKPARYSSDEKYTLLEYYVRKMLTDEVRGQVMEIVEERRPEIAEMIGAELRKEATYQSFANAFIRSLTNALDNQWRPCIEVTFNEQKEEVEF